MNKKDDKKVHIYHITLTNGELLKTFELKVRLNGAFQVSP